MQVLAAVTWNFRPDFVSRNYESAGICEGTGEEEDLKNWGAGVGEGWNFVFGRFAWVSQFFL